jgi:hypothetical protein
MSEELLGIRPAPHPKHEHEGADYPKWVKPHDSHIVVGATGAISVPGFSEFHLDRMNNSVTVLVEDAKTEKRALAQAKKKGDKAED